MMTVMERIKRIGNEIHKSIPLEDDYPFKYSDRKVPILDVKVCGCISAQNYMGEADDFFLNVEPRRLSYFTFDWRRDCWETTERLEAESSLKDQLQAAQRPVPIACTV